MTERGSTWGVVPAKCFRRAKGRLVSVLDEGARALLARELLDHVLGVLAASPRLDGVVVVTECEEVERLARAHDALVARSPEGEPLATILDAVLVDLARRGAAKALVVMADLPRFCAADVEALLDGLERADFVVAPDRRDAGTNAVAVAPPDLVRVCFGEDRSFSGHCERAANAGARVRVYRGEGVACDVDTPGDYSDYLAMEQGRVRVQRECVVGRGGGGE